MAQYQVIIDTDMLQHLFSKDEGLAKLAEQVLNQILKAQASKHEGQKPYERTDERQGYRNGRRERSLTIRIGKLVLEVPRLGCTNTRGSGL